MLKKNPENFLPQEFSTVSVQQLNIVDTHGNPRATFGTKHNGDVAIELYGQDRKRRLIMETRADGEPSIKLFGPPDDDGQEDGTVVAEVAIHNDGVAVISVDCKDQASVGLILEYGEDPYISIFTSDRQRMMFPAKDLASASREITAL